MVPAWPSTAGGGKPGSSVTANSVPVSPSCSAAGTQPEPMTRAMSCCSTPVSSRSRVAARSASAYGSEVVGVSTARRYLPPRDAPRCTRPTGWSQAADGWESAECAVASSSVVVLEPGRKGGGALVVAGEDLPVGPLGLQGPVQPLDLPVLPGAVGADELLPDAVGSAHLAQRPPVGPRVVGHQPLDAGDPPGGEVLEGPGQELGAGGARLVGQDLGVGQP